MMSSTLPPADRPVHHTTRHLGPQPVTTAQPTRSVTGPLDRSVPWVIELRVVGTASTVQVQVHDEMIIGRRDSDLGVYPEIDLSEFQSLHYGVSRRHAMICVQEGRLHVRDLGSTNGTQINGQLCEANRDYRLRHNDELTVGRLRMQISFAVVPSHENNTRDEKPTAPLDIQKSGAGQRVLIIEDDADVGGVFSIALQQAGYRVTVAGDVASGLAAYSNTPPDVLILDLMLPDMNGLELLRYLRKQRSPRHIPTLVVSGQTAGYKQQLALEAGADQFLGKPIAVEDLVKAVGTAIGVSAL